MKKWLLLFILSPWLCFASSPSDAIFNDLNGIENADQLYKTCQTMGAIWNEVKPVVSVPAVIGFEQGRAPMADLCYAVTQMHLYSGRLKELREKYNLENLSQDAITKKLVLSAAIYALNTSSLDDNPDKTPSSIAANRKRRKFSAFYRRNSRISLSNAALDPAKKETIERNEELAQRLANLSGRREELASKMNCKTGLNTNIKEKYERNLMPLQNAWETAADEREFYFNELLQLSGQYRRERQALDYGNELKTIDGNGIVLVPTNVEKTVDSAEKRKQADGSFKMVPAKAKITVQTFSTNINDQLFQDFATKWSRTWKETVKQNADQILDALERGSDCDKYLTDYADMVKKPAEASDAMTRRAMSCTKKKEMSPKQASQIFEENWTGYKNAYRREKDLEAQMLTVESDLLGEPVAPTKDELKRIISAEKPQCTEELSVADMEKLKKDQMLVEGELRQIYTESQMQKSQVMETREQQLQEEREFYKTSREMRVRDAEKEQRDLKKAPRVGSF